MKPPAFHESGTDQTCVDGVKARLFADSMRNRSILGRGLGAQLASFALAGLLTNAALYALYLLLTRFGTSPLLAMSVSYLAGAMLGFAVNGRCTFPESPKGRRTFIRFAAAHALGYLFNAAGLSLAVAHWGVAHYWAQLFMVGATAVLLFVLQRWWVFTIARSNPIVDPSD